VATLLVLRTLAMYVCVVRSGSKCSRTVLQLQVSITRLSTCISDSALTTATVQVCWLSNPLHDVLTYIYDIVVAMAKRLRGAALQKALLDPGDAASSEPVKESALANTLLTLWSLGQVSAVLVHKIAYMATLDVAQHPELFIMARARDKTLEKVDLRLLHSD